MFGDIHAGVYGAADCLGGGGKWVCDVHGLHHRVRNLVVFLRRRTEGMKKGAHVVRSWWMGGAHCCAVNLWFAAGCTNVLVNGLKNKHRGTGSLDAGCQSARRGSVLAATVL